MPVLCRQFEPLLGTANAGKKLSAPVQGGFSQVVQPRSGAWHMDETNCEIALKAQRPSCSVLSARVAEFGYICSSNPQHVALGVRDVACIQAATRRLISTLPSRDSHVLVTSSCALWARSDNAPERSFFDLLGVAGCLEKEIPGL